MSRRPKRKSRSTSVTIERVADSGSLTERANTAAILYGTLQRVAKEGPNGTKQALVSVESSEINVEAPPYSELQRLCETYGVMPSMVASETEPTPLIPKYEDEETATQKDPIARTALRQVLRRLVDEV